MMAHFRVCRRAVGSSSVVIRRANASWLLDSAHGRVNSSALFHLRSRRPHPVLQAPGHGLQPLGTGEAVDLPRRTSALATMCLGG